MKITQIIKKYLIISALFCITCIFNACKTNTPTPIFDANAKLDSTYNAQWQNQTNFIAGQNAYALRLINGKTLWMYNNVHLNDKVNGEVPCNTYLYNAAVLQDGNTFTVLNNGNTDWIPSNPYPFRINSASQYDDTIFVYSSSIYVINITSVAKFLYPSLAYVGTSAVLHPAADAETFQHAFANVADSVTGYLYHYGYKKNNNNFDVFVGRHPLDNPGKKWTYWNGTTWVNNTNNLAVILSSTEMPTCIRKINGAYICITQNAGVGCGTGLSISSLYAAIPEGPFNGKVKLFSIPQTWQGFSPNAVGACIQPSFIDGVNDKRVLITYSLNGYSTCANDCNAGFTNPAFYSTYGFTVPLRSLNPAW
jgi:hypothetical protein